MWWRCRSRGRWRELERLIVVSRHLKFKVAMGNQGRHLKQVSAMLVETRRERLRPETQSYD